MLYRFHDFEIDEQLYQLRCAGKPVEIEPRVFNVLAYLLQHHNRVVLKMNCSRSSGPSRSSRSRPDPLHCGGAQGGG